MNLIGEPIDAYKALEIGLVNEVVPDHELFDTALSWARKLAGQAPLAIEQIKKVSANGDLDEGLQAEAQGFAAAFQSEDAKEGIGAFLGKRKAQFKGQSGGVGAARLADLLGEAERRRPDRSGDLGAIRDPRLPHAREGLWEKVNPMEVAHIDAFRRDPDRFWQFYSQRFMSLRDKQPNARTVVASGAARPDPRRDHAEHRPAAPRRRHQAADRGARLDLAQRLPRVRRRFRSRRWSSS